MTSLISYMWLYVEERSNGFLNKQRVKKKQKRNKKGANGCSERRGMSRAQWTLTGNGTSSWVAERTRLWSRLLCYRGKIFVAISLALLHIGSVHTTGKRQRSVYDATACCFAPIACDAILYVRLKVSEFTVQSKEKKAYWERPLTRTRTQSSWFLYTAPWPWQQSSWSTSGTRHLPIPDYSFMEAWTPSTRCVVVARKWSSSDTWYPTRLCSTFLITIDIEELWYVLVALGL